MTYVKVKFWFDGFGGCDHCVGDDETAEDTYTRASGEREGIVEKDVCTSTPWGENDLLRAVQVDVEAFDVQERGYLSRFC
jgi:hypothetical protein